VRYPKNLKIGDYIGVTAPSAGVAKEEDLPRLNTLKIILKNLVINI